MRLENIDLSYKKKLVMELDRELEAMRRRLNRIAPIKSPPELKKLREAMERIEGEPSGIIDI